MAVLKNYNREYHDLHIFSPSVSLNPKKDGVPVSYNSHCAAAQYNVDFSGCAAKNQRFNNRSSYGQSDWENINYWNNGYFAAVLITPKHALICQHYYAAIPSQVNELKWLGKSENTYTRKVKRTKQLNPYDIRLVEFETEFPADDVKIYSKIADVRYIPKETEMWMQDGQCRIYRTRLKDSRTSDGTVNTDPTTWTSKPFLDDGMGYNEGLPFNGMSGPPQSPNVFSGDSGSPTFVLDKAGNTILVGLAYGGHIIPPALINTLKEEIGSQYSIQYVKLSARLGDYNQDGKVDAGDQTSLLAAWGTDNKEYDLDGDGFVDAGDMGILMSNWGEYTLENSVFKPQPQPPLPPINNPKPKKR
jgi:hypothetical protein